MTLIYYYSHLHPHLAKFIDDVVHYERWRLYHARASDETYPASMPTGTSLEVMVGLLEARLMEASEQMIMRLRVRFSRVAALGMVCSSGGMEAALCTARWHRQRTVGHSGEDSFG
jgi:hypothetical protein